MIAGRQVAVGALLVLVGAAAWWVMSGVDAGPDVPEAGPGAVAAAPSAASTVPAPAAPAVPLRRPPPPPADALRAGDLPEVASGEPDPGDAEHFQAVARASMDTKLAAISAQFAAAGGLLRGAARDDVQRVLDDAYGEMRDVASQLGEGQIDPGAAFGEVERIRDRAGRELDATLPADQAADVKAAAGVRSAEEAAGAVDWGIPLDDATSAEIFK